jgi:hypothetical protein
MPGAVPMSDQMSRALQVLHGFLGEVGLDVGIGHVHQGRRAGDGHRLFERRQLQLRVDRGREPDVDRDAVADDGREPGEFVVQAIGAGRQ